MGLTSNFLIETKELFQFEYFVLSANTSHFA